MDEEKRIIKLIDSVISRCGRSFESDSEIFNLNGISMLFSIDEFSKEDNFRESDPGVLGANLATGSISDILASGGIPLYYAHAMVIGDTWDDWFIKEFSHGIADVLAKAKITFLGGDLGKSKNWHYTASVIGKTPSKPVLRTGARAGENIYITGRIGAGNLEAALTLYLEKYSGNKMMSKIIKSTPNKLVLRLDESRLIREYASCCIDTSDGVFNALNEIAEINDTGYMVKDIPYIKKGKILAHMLSLPVVLLFLAECGEYELLFTLPRENEKEFRIKAKEAKLNFFKIGNLTESHLKILEEKKTLIDLTNLKIRARDYHDSHDYIDALRNWLDKWMGNNEK